MSEFVRCHKVDGGVGEWAKICHGGGGRTPVRPPHVHPCLKYSLLGSPLFSAHATNVRSIKYRLPVFRSLQISFITDRSTLCLRTISF